MDNSDYHINNLKTAIKNPNVYIPSLIVIGFIVFGLVSKKKF